MSLGRVFFGCDPVALSGAMLRRHPNGVELAFSVLLTMAKAAA